MDGARTTQALLRHLDAGLSGRPEDELIAQVLGGAEPPAALLATAGRLARIPFWERRALGAAGLVRDHRVAPREAIRLAALWELAERWYPDERPAVTTPGAALHLLQGLRSAAREEVWVLLLDARHRLISVEPVVAGTLNSARLLPRDVLAPALRAGAAAVIVAHNHPSGEVTPSRADRLVTAALRDASRLLGLPLLDHLIVTSRSHYSFRETEAWEAETATAA
ncbi:MAG: JAB domain-containing protein [Candidatus Dormibacteria bacterium]|jgi:DNA repair protein RadC